jgi:hypothetical protein
MGFIKRIRNDGLQGGVTGPVNSRQTRSRIREILDLVFGNDSGASEAMPVYSGDHPNRKGKGRRDEVSLEGMAGDTLDMQTALDDLVEKENLGHGAEAPQTDGLAPCQRVNRGEEGKGRRL